MALLGYEFWKRVDELRGDIKLSKLANDLDLNYTTIRNQRSENRYPKNEDISKIANYLGTTEGYLISGESGELSKLPEDRPIPTSDNEEYEYILKIIEKHPELCKKLVELLKEVENNK